LVEITQWGLWLRLKLRGEQEVTIDAVSVAAAYAAGIVVGIGIVGGSLLAAGVHYHQL
jgi:hypothetical protein